MSDFSTSQKQFLKQLVADLREDLDKKTREIKEEVKQQIGDLKRKVHTTLKAYEEKISTLERKNEALENEIKDLNRKTRKNNIVIFGINKAQTNPQTSVLKLFREALKLDISSSDFNDIYHLGPKDKIDTPILIEFQSYQKKELLLKNYSKLGQQGVFISHDQSKEDRAIKKILLKHRWEARKKGIQAFIKGNKLQIGKEIYTVEELENQTSTYNPLESEKPNSAPSTPNPHLRQKTLFEEFGTVDGTQQENKSCKPETSSNTKTSTPRALRSKSKPVDT